MEFTKNRAIGEKILKIFLLNTITSLIFAILLQSCAKISLFPQKNSEVSPTLPATEVVQKIEKAVERPLPEVVAPYFERAQVSSTQTQAIKKYCQKIDQRFLNWGWGLSSCQDFGWHHVRDSVQGDPLMWTVFGDEQAHRRDHQNMTLIMCGVHGDEITPIKFCFDIMNYLNQNFNKSIFKDSLVVVFPIANPDSFFKKRATRTNARGVDINRNLPTKDWNADAQRIWRERYRSDPRRNPGPSAMSEPETLTQVNMIKRYRPDKIISVHAPLTILDYDGPVELHEIHGDVGASASELLIQMSQKAQGYQIRNYPFFPGSLGNFAGNERGIPTYTLELPSSDNRKHRQYWDQFKKAIKLAIIHNLADSSGKAEGAQLEAKAQ